MSHFCHPCRAFHPDTPHVVPELTAGRPRRLHPEEEALLAFAVGFWFVIDGPGSASWRAGFRLVVEMGPRGRLHRLIAHRAPIGA